jgi:hypothetical protein
MTTCQIFLSKLCTDIRMRKKYFKKIFLSKLCTDIRMRKKYVDCIFLCINKYVLAFIVFLPLKKWKTEILPSESILDFGSQGHNVNEVEYKS